MSRAIDFGLGEIPLTVIDAKISTETGGSYVSVFLNRGGQSVGLSGYSVSIISDLGDINNFSSIGNEAGIYTSTDSNFVGLEGRAYRLEITDLSDNLYQSAFDTIFAPSDFEIIVEDSVIPNFEFAQDSKATSVAIVPNSSSYFSKFNFELSYQHYYTDETITNVSEDNFLLFQCTDEAICGSEVEEFVENVPRRTWTFNTGRCTACNCTGCCICFPNYQTTFTISQEVMSQEGFKFWNDVQALLENNGLLFDTYPFPIKGNVSCEDCSFEFVGFFRTVSTNTKSVDVAL